MNQVTADDRLDRVEAIVTSLALFLSEGAKDVYRLLTEGESYTPIQLQAELIRLLSEHEGEKDRRLEDYLNSWIGTTNQARLLGMALEDLAEVDEYLGSDAPRHRYVPVEVFVDTHSGPTGHAQFGRERARNAAREGAFIRELDNAIRSLGFQSIVNYGTESGSIFKRSLWRSKGKLTTPDLRETLELLGRSLELRHLDLVQAQVDEKHAQAFASVMASANDVPNFAVKLGAILIIKTTDDSGETSVASITLTQRQLLALDSEPHLFKEPAKLLEVLNQLSTEDGPKSLPSGSPGD